MASGPLSDLGRTARGRRQRPFVGSEPTGKVRPRIDGEVCLDTDKAVRLAFRCRQAPALITSCLRRKRFHVAEAGQKDDPGFEIVGIWRMSARQSLVRLQSNERYR